MNDKISIRNGIELNIGKEWDKCIDKFGNTFTRECAITYREHTRQVISEKISFLEWCSIAKGDIPTRAASSRINDIQAAFPKGSRIRLVRYGGRQDLTLGVKGTGRGVTKKVEILVAFDTKQRVRLAMERDLCELVEKSEDSGLNDEALVEEKPVLYKHPTICISCGRFLAQSTHFRTMVFSNKGKRSTIEMCSQCVRYIRKHKLNYDRNGLKGILTEKAG